MAGEHARLRRPRLLPQGHGGRAIALEASGGGLWGNDLRVSTRAPDPEVADDVARRLGVAADALFDLTVEHRPPEGQGGITQEVFRNLTAVDSPRNVRDVLAADSALVRVLTLPPGAPGTVAEVRPPRPPIWSPGCGC